MAARIAHVMQACFNGKRIVVFSGGEAKDLDGLYDEVRAIRDGGGNGSIIGRNTFQRPRAEALPCSTRSSRSIRARPNVSAAPNIELRFHRPGDVAAGRRLLPASDRRRRR
jgi:hypothetical protein